MEQLLSLLKTIPEYAAMVSSLQGGESVAVTGIGQINRSHMIAGLCRSLSRPMVVLCQDDLAARRLQEEKRERFVESLEQTPFVVVQDELVLMQYEDLREIPSVAKVVDLYLDWMPSVEGVLFVVRVFVVC